MGLSEAVRRLLADCVRSASEVEIVLLLHGDAERSWSPEEVDARLRIGEAGTLAGLRRLCAAGLLTLEQKRYRFQPADGARHRAVDQLADAYARRRVRVIEFLYGNSLSGA